MENKTVKILGIDDNNDNLIVLKALLADKLPEAKFVYADSGKKGIELAKVELPDVILLDIIMPVMDGFEVCAKLKEDELLKHIPIIILTAAKTDMKSRVKALEIGADAFLAKPIDEAELLAQINVMLRIKKSEEMLRKEKTSLSKLVKDRTAKIEKELGERKIIEKTLEENEQFLESIINNIGDPIFVKDDQSRLLVVNDAFCKLFGLNKENIIGKTLAEDVTSAEQESFVKIDKQVIKDGLENINEEPLTVRGGETKIISTKKTRYVDDKGGKFLIGVTRDITEKKLMEDKLRESDEKFRNLFENSSVGNSFTNIDGTIDFNNAFCEMLGYSKDEMLNTHWQAISHPDEIEEITKILTSLINGDNKSARFEKRYRHKNGNFIWADISTVLQRDEEGKPKYFITNAVNINESKIVELELVGSEKRYKKAQSMGHVGNWEYYPITTTFWASDEAKRIYGFNLHSPGFSTEMVESCIPERIRVHQALVDLIEHDVEYDLIFDLITSDKGIRKTIHSIAESEKDGNGNVVKITGVISDITKRINVEKKLNESEEKFRSLFEQSGGYCMILDPNTPDGIPVIIDANNAACLSHGYTKDEFIGRRVVDLDDVDGKMLTKQRTLEIMTGKPFFVENTHVRKDGTTFSVMVNAKRIDIGDEPPIIFTTEYDITKRKVTEEELKASKERFDLAMAATKDGLFDWNLLTNEVYYSPGWKSMLGYMSEELPNEFSTWEKLIEPEGGKKALEMMQELMDKRSDGFYLEFKMKHKDGHWVDILSRAEAVFDDNNKAVRIVGTHVDISERKHAEKTLRDTSMRHSAMIENIGDVISIVDEDGKTKYQSPNIEKWFGWKPEEVYGNKGLEMVHPEDIAMVKEEFSKILKKDTKSVVEYRFKCKDGNYKWIELTAQNCINNSTIRGVLLNYHDITNSKLTELAIKKSELEFRSVWENATSGMRITNKDGIIVRVNDAFCKMFEKTKEELEGKSLSEIYSTEKKEHVKNKHIEKFKDRKVKLNFEKELNIWNGETIWVHVSNSYIDIEGEELLLGVFTDISKRKKAEEKVVPLSMAVEQNPASIVITNPAGNIEYVNPKFCEVTGYTLEEVIGNNPRILKYGDKPKEEYKELWDTITSGKTWKGEFQNKKKDGSMYWESASISPIFNEKGNINSYVAVKEDISEKKEMINNLVVAKESSEKADKMKSIFLAQMSHEIRTPINAIVGMSSIIKMDFKEAADEDQMQSFEIVENAGDRIIRTIDLLINLSEVQAGTYETINSLIDLHTDIIIPIIAENKKLATKKDIGFSFHIATDDTTVIADEYTVNQIFSQLIDNALKFTESGDVKVNMRKNRNHKLVVEIEDTGVGIEDEYLPELFEPFTQEEMGYSRKFDGNGIGLALVKTYCKLNNAKIEVESVKGVGSSFRVIFE